MDTGLNYYYWIASFNYELQSIKARYQFRSAATSICGGSSCQILHIPFCAVFVAILNL